ncbi:MAG: hypothetical protein LQ348_000995 [Seirophora lacunosa]|nr:MAG: hypothetical protein LQ344_000156 [Seirophora lacunosa]KAI4206366.1 MAG: hypothetical protein LQ348_000995 [Seirophora lacunosa]
MAGSKVTRNPSPYRPLSFHLLRLGQSVSAIIVSSVLSFFVYYLLHERYKLPWTFIFLLTAALSTIASLLVTTVLYFFRTLPPRYNLINNAALSVLWVLGLSFLTWNLGWTLGHRCLIANWKTEAGITVCRLYKSCTAFTVTGLLTTLLALLLDVTTYRTSTQLGKYNRMQGLDVKRSAPIISAPILQDEPLGSPRARDTDDLGEQKPYRVQDSIQVQHFGYSAPPEQTRYDPAHGAF